MSSNIVDLLRGVAPFSGLSEEEAKEVAAGCSVVRIAAGSHLFEKGDDGDRAYIVVEGELEVTVPGPDGPLLLGVVGPGDLVGEAALIRGSTRAATVTARVDAVAVAVEAAALLAAVGPGTRSLLALMLDRLDAGRERVMQAERLVQLGTLAAGVAHELNNPASAVRRGAAALVAAVDRLVTAVGELAGLPSALLDAIGRLPAATAPPPGALERAELESEMTQLLEEAGVPEPWSVAYEAVASGVGVDELARIIATHPGEAGVAALRLLTTLAAARGIAGEISLAAGHLSEVAAALSTYTRLGEAPVGEVDVVAGLRQALMLLRHRLDGIRLVEDYEVDLPPVPGVGGELSQVWTNLVANAADATGPGGTITLRARRRDGGVVVEVEDDGVGIEPDHLPRIFDAFYTTKPPGSGTGLGLSISHRIVTVGHGGTLEVESRPGRTLFRARLPLASTTPEV